MNEFLAGGGELGEIQHLRLPRPAGVFGKRAARFLELAAGHAAQDYLEALASLAEAQRSACGQVPVTLPRQELSGVVPLRAAEWPRDGAWREALRVILSEMRAAPLPPPARAAVDRLRAAPPEELEGFAGALLAGAHAPLDLAAAPFVGAALQAYWTSLAAELPAAAVERAERGCPVCGSPPVAGVVLGDDKLRYLACSLCASQWHLARVHCASCRATGGISYLTIEGAAGAVKAEACSVCRSYLKLFYLERDPAAEPFADDVATLALDLLVAEEGYARGGVNLFLLPGAES